MKRKVGAILVLVGLGIMAGLPFAETSAEPVPEPVETLPAPVSRKYPCCTQFSITMPLPAGCDANPAAPPPCYDAGLCNGTTSTLKPDSTCENKSANPSSKCALGNGTCEVEEMEKNCNLNRLPCACSLNGTGRKRTVQYKECSFDSDACPAGSMP